MSQKTEVRRPKLEGRSRKTEVGRPKSEEGRLKLSEKLSQNLIAKS
jgi:hypothetical protein